MAKMYQTGIRWLRSDNLKAAPQTIIQNLKWLGLSVIAFVLMVTGAVAEEPKP